MKRLSISMTVCLMILFGCSTKPPITITETVYQKDYIPLNVLLLNCTEKAAGVTVRSLSSSWVNNTSCLRAHQKLVEGLIKNHTLEGINNAKIDRGE